MAVILVDIEDTFDQWRKKTNNISIGVGDFRYLNSGDTTIVRAVNRNWTNIGTLSALSTTLKSTLVDSINEVDNNTDLNTVSIGVLGNLNTTDKSSLVNAVNEVEGEIGNLPSLTTDAKTNLVVAINEVDAHADTNTTNIGNMGNLTNGPTLVDGIEYNLVEIEDILDIIGNPASFPWSGQDIQFNLYQLNDHIGELESIVGSDPLNTTANYVTGAINELYASSSVIGDLANLETEEKGTIVGAVNEIYNTTASTNASIGNLLMLDTGVRTDLVSAINEVATNTIVMALILG